MSTLPNWGHASTLCIVGSPQLTTSCSARLLCPSFLSSSLIPKYYYILMQWYTYLIYLYSSSLLCYQASRTKSLLGCCHCCHWFWMIWVVGGFSRDFLTDILRVLLLLLFCLFGSIFVSRFRATMVCFTRSILRIFPANSTGETVQWLGIEKITR